MDFNDRCATLFAAETHKRVNYAYGLVLGVGEFRTEQSYFLEKHRRHARSLHGYGTVAGLAVGVRDTAADGPEIRVSPGLAIDPHGREICVPEAQCAPLDGWLLQRAQAGELSPPLDASPPGRVRAYVTLCYRECETDKVPIPVGPCHSLDKSSVASRIQDAFELRIVETPPAQVEEEALRRLAAVMARVSVAPGGMTTPDALVAEIRALAPEASPPDEPGSMPPDFLLDPQHAAAIVRAALRVFVTEVRPMLVPEGGGCLNGPRDATCLLLAQLDFDVEEAAGVPRVSGPVQITEDERPLLLPTRALQGRLDGGAGSAAPWALSAPGSNSLLFAPQWAEPVSNLVTIEPLGNALPALRFRRNGAALFSFRLPPNLDAGGPYSLRLEWAYSRPAGAAPSLAWNATLRLLSAGDSLTAPAPGATAALLPATAAADLGRLLVTERAELSLAAVPPQPRLGSLEVRLTSPAAIPADVEIYLVSAELAYTPRGGIS
jgi:hypothetical protein